MEKMGTFWRRWELFDSRWELFDSRWKLFDKIFYQKIWPKTAKNRQILPNGKKKEINIKVIESDRGFFFFQNPVVNRPFLLFFCSFFLSTGFSVENKVD